MTKLKLNIFVTSFPYWSSGSTAGAAGTETNVHAPFRVFRDSALLEQQVVELRARQQVRIWCYEPIVRGACVWKGFGVLGLCVCEQLHLCVHAVNLQVPFGIWSNFLQIDSDASNYLIIAYMKSDDDTDKPNIPIRRQTRQKSQQHQMSKIRQRRRSCGRRCHHRLCANRNLDASAAHPCPLSALAASEKYKRCERAHTRAAECIPVYSIGFSHSPDIRRCSALSLNSIIQSFYFEYRWWRRPATSYRFMCNGRMETKTRRFFSLSSLALSLSRSAHAFCYFGFVSRAQPFPTTVYTHTYAREQ